ncbi:sugar ABC transporter substrate-binding protein [Arthrobacter sp. GMC3]|uniref:ABC transporter substrate-binding protein n=1 Tax=Arthrobacter sp. GMC3 TaxID=2058894 RepID=UPI000CE53AE4|nr:sugar ABC transporter substrate-binding protein [Arthrobacter sp. GMC3]
MKRRSLLIGAAGLFGTGLLMTACGTDDNQAVTNAPAAAPKGEVTFWSSLAGMDKVTEAFNASQSDIKVTFESVPNGASGGYAKLSTAITAGNGPDVSTIEYANLPQFVSNGQVEPLDKLVDKAASVDKYYEQIRGLVQFGGATYGLPYDAAPMIMWYRKDLLDKAGVGVPKTWADFEAAGKALQQAVPGTYLASFNPNEPTVTAALAWQAGGKWFSAAGDSWKVGINDASSKKIADFWQKLIDAKIVKVEQSFSDEWSMDLAKGNVAGVLGANWSATGIQKRVEGSDQKGAWIAAEVPNWGTPAGAFYGGSSFNVAKGSKNPAAAAKFIQFLATDQAAVAARGNTGSAFLAFPGLTATAQKAYDASFFGNDIYAVFEAAYKVITPGWQWGPNWEITNTAIKDAFGKLSTSSTIGAALDSAQKATVEGLKQTGLSVTQ